MPTLVDEQRALDILQRQVAAVPETLFILGSGWNAFSHQLETQTEIGYEEWLGVKAGVPGHEGKLVIGRMKNGELKMKNGQEEKRVALMVGRLHTYEGYTAGEVTLPIRVLAQAGVKTMVVTSASGALNETYKVGDIVVLSDVLTLLLSPDNPLVGPKFQDMSEVFDRKLRLVARSVLQNQRTRFHEGVYAYYHGPNFETPADKRALRVLGADMVGMSTVPEVIMGAHLGLKMLGLSLVTNLAFVKHSHIEVLREAKKVGASLGQLLSMLV